MEHNVLEKEYSRDVFSSKQRCKSVFVGYINDSRKNKLMTVRVEGNCRSDILEKQEGRVEKSRIHMEDLAFNRSYHTIQELNWQDSDYIDGSPIPITPG